MFNTPDNADAVPACPPFDPPGPVPRGFYKDCKTIPVAEDFNELIVNLRALLLKEGGPQQPIKGVSRILWEAIVNLPVINYDIILQVAPGGVALPDDPLTEPFSDLRWAMNWLAHYRIG